MLRKKNVFEKVERSDKPLFYARGLKSWQQKLRPTAKFVTNSFYWQHSRQLCSQQTNPHSLRCYIHLNWHFSQKHTHGHVHKKMTLIVNCLISILHDQSSRSTSVPSRCLIPDIIHDQEDWVIILAILAHGHSTYQGSMTNTMGIKAIRDQRIRILDHLEWQRGFKPSKKSLLICKRHRPYNPSENIYKKNYDQHWNFQLILVNCTEKHQSFSIQGIF